MTPAPLAYWLGFHLALVLLLATEYALHRLVPDPHRKAVWATVLWTAAALALAGCLISRFHAAGVTQYLAGYAIEQALSVDNLFVFLLLFRLFAIPSARQSKALFWGVAGAILMRGLFIAGGLTLLAKFHAVEYVFAALLLVAAIRLLKQQPETAESEPPRWLAWLTRVRPVSARTDVFLAREPVAGDDSNPASQTLRLMPTLLLLAVIAIELADVIFAFDSIPAVLSITRVPFLAYTSNIMAVMGLRSLYILLAEMLKKLRYMHFGLAAILAFAALKMLLADWINVGALTSLAVIAGLLAVTIAASVLAGPRASKTSAPPQ